MRNDALAVLAPPTAEASTELATDCRYAFGLAHALAIGRFGWDHPLPAFTLQTVPTPDEDEEEDDDDDAGGDDGNIEPDDDEGYDEDEDEDDEEPWQVRAALRVADCC